jgi:hypothetical protein
LDRSSTFFLCYPQINPISDCFDEEAVMKHLDRSILEMALIGYEAERQKIEAAMAAIRRQVDGHAAARAVNGARRLKRNIVGRSQAPNCGGAAEALGGVPRGEEG